jgi:hypothetical protein
MEELTGADRGRCPLCCNRSDSVVRRYRQDSPDAEPVPSDTWDDPKPCPVCGWEPNVTEIVEVVVHTREQAQAALGQLKETAEAEEGYL